MRHAVLLGVPDTRRTQYLMAAAGQVGLDLSFLDWETWQKDIASYLQDGMFMKIDPPGWDSCALKALDSLSADYKGQLWELSHAADTYDIRFFNHPSAIASLLDKAKCKEALLRAGLPVTEFLAKASPGSQTASAACPNDRPVECRIVQDAEQLLEMMERQGICQVFIKPVNGSGAAGVSAFRWQRNSGRMALYTCAMEHPTEGIVNTKRLQRFSDTGKVLFLLDQLLQTECIIERWHAKAEHQGYSYDLRAVVQDGRMDYLLARLSKGPITNLHLNNRPLHIDALGLPFAALDAITELSLKAMDLFPGLTSAGIDILLEKGSLKPRIIEMNGQGDLIYQDIFGENIIYRRQAEFIKRAFAAVGQNK